MSRGCPNTFNHFELLSKLQKMQQPAIVSEEWEICSAEWEKCMPSHVFVVRLGIQAKEEDAAAAILQQAATAPLCKLSMSSQCGSMKFPTCSSFQIRNGVKDESTA